MFQFFLPLVSASAVTSLSLPYASSLECHQCIRSGFIYNIPVDLNSDFYNRGLKGIIPEGGSYAGECCENMSDTTNCGSSIASANTLHSNWATVNPVGIDLDIAITRCPMKQDLCGAIRGYNLEEPETITMSGAWASTD